MERSTKFPKLNFPSYSFRAKTVEGKPYIFDDIRKKFLLLTPEEWVRQHVVFYLVHEKGYPKSHISIEKSLDVNGQQLRYDVVVFNRNKHPIILVECKAPKIKITQDTFDQIAVYNLHLDVPYLMLTNGLQTVYCQMNFETKGYDFLRSLPSYK